MNTTPATLTEALADSGDPSTRGGPAIELLGAGHRFGSIDALGRVDLRIAAGATVAVVGPSGCGKSTLLELVAGLLAQSDGEIAVHGQRDAADRLSLCAFMPQRDLLLPWLSALDNAALALRASGVRRAAARAAAAPIFERLGLAGFEQARPAQMSGGMRQRVAFARTLLGGRPVLLLDEPFAALDAITRADLQQWLAAALRAEPRTTLLVTHDLEEALYLADRVVILSPRPGLIVWEGAAPKTDGVARNAAVTSPDFVAARERALAALAQGRP